MKKIKEPCCVSDIDCKSPAGWGGSFGFAVNTDLIPLQPCYSCGRAVCDKCSLTKEYYGQQQRLCRACAEEYDRHGPSQTFNKKKE